MSAILVINAGSSSLKFNVFGVDGAGEPVRLIKGQIESLHAEPRMSAKDGDGAKLADEALGSEGRGHEGALAHLLSWLDPALGERTVTAAGHRVVHGGDAFTAPVLVDEDVLAKLEALTPLAPLHQPHNIAGVRALERAFPGLPQVACFDTAFHATKRAEASAFALPRELTEAGVRRYGFHGLSYEYIASALPDVAPELARGRVVVAHLGSGASMCAMRDGRCVDVSMGFTAVDGLPMGTRCGALDPGVVLYLAREKGMALDDIETLMYNRSGLKGVSGISNDMRELEASADPRAREAIDLFAYRIRQTTAALAAAMEGIDALVFTAGIGENSAFIRGQVLEGLEWMGIQCDPDANASGETRISREGSPVAALVVPTNEELMIARHVLALRPD